MPAITKDELRKIPREQRQMLPRQREATINSVNAEERKVTLSFASEEPCPDYWGDPEILRCNDQAADISRFTAGVMPVLFNHNRDAVIGRPTRIWFEDTKAYAEIQFDDDDESTRIWNKVQSGSLRGVSVGYRVNEWRFIEKNQVSEDGITGPAWIGERWAVYEISIVSVPADATVGVGRSLFDDESLLTILNNHNGGINMEEKKNPEEQQRNVEVPATGITASANPPAAPTVNVEEERAAAVKAERERQAQINGLCRQFGIEDQQREAWLNSDVSIETVNRSVLEILSARQAAQPTAGKPQFGAAEEDKMRAAYRDAILLRNGLNVEKPADGAEKMRYMSMRDIAIDMLLRADERDVMRLAPEELFKRAMTTGALPALLADTTQAALVRGYEDAMPTYQIWARIGQLRDFRPQYLVNVGLDAEPVKIPENGEFTEAQLKESKKFVRLDTYGRSYSYTRQAFINDDQDVLVTIPYQLAQKFAMAINREAYKALTGGSYSANVNLGTAGAISTTTLSEAMTLLRKQKGDLSKNYLRIMPRYLVVPVTQSAVAAQLLRSTADPEASNSGVVNIYRGALTLVDDPELDDISTTAWYLLGNQVQGEGVEVDFLNGNRTPILESQVSFETLGWKYRMYLDYGVKLLSTTGIVKNAGE